MKRARASAGGIIIPDSAKEKPQQGEVISVGKGKSNDEGKVFPLDVKAGDSILFGKYSGTEIKLDGEELLIMREEEVLGILSKNRHFVPCWMRLRRVPVWQREGHPKTRFEAGGRDHGI